MPEKNAYGKNMSTRERLERRIFCVVKVNAKKKNMSEVVTPKNSGNTLSKRSGVSATTVRT
jgi:hypothetical protein